MKKTLNLIGRFNKPVLLGSIAGDVIGSFYERNSTKKQDFHLFCPFSTFTDDTVMTVAIAEWLLTSNDLSQIMRRYGRSYPHAGYGGTFRKWLQGEISGPYNSFGNGSAMRVSPVGWAFDTLEETLRAAKKVQNTHTTTRKASKEHRQWQHVSIWQETEKKNKTSKNI